MSPKSNLRKMLESWRGKGFTEEEAKAFDITALLGKACLINIIHEPSADGTRQFEKISSITTIPKSMKAFAAVNKIQVLSFDGFDQALFDAQPDFIKDKIKSSEEYKAMVSDAKEIPHAGDNGDDDDDVPF